MKITWIGHSCFKIEKDGYAIVLDPYEDGKVPGYSAVDCSANEILCSHEHADHGCRSAVDLVESDQSSPFEVELIPWYHDEVQGAKRGPNNITIISDGVQKIVHFGDLGCEPEEDQLAKLMNVDCLLIPVGGFYTIDGAQAAELVRKLNPRMVIPMHYRDDEAGFGYDVISTVEPFLNCMGGCVTVDGCDVETESQYDAQVVVVKPGRG